MSSNHTISKMDGRSNAHRHDLVMVTKVQQGRPILFIAKDKPEQSLLISKAFLRTHGNYRQVSFHHAHMFRVHYL